MDLHRAYPDLFTKPEADQLSALMGPPKEMNGRQRIARANAPINATHFLERGFAAGYRSDRMARRQLVSLHLPGDFLDLSSCMLGHLDHDIDAITPVTLRPIPRAGLAALRAGAPTISDHLFRVSLLDASISRYWIFRVGRLVGRARIANFFGEILLRLDARGFSSLEQFDLPITQGDLADACGMTPVHANRMIGELREEGLCTFSDGRVTITDLAGLFRTGQSAWDYLFLPDAAEQRLRQHLQAGNGSTIRNVG